MIVFPMNHLQLTVLVAHIHTNSIYPILSPLIIIAVASLRFRSPVLCFCSSLA